MNARRGRGGAIRQRLRWDLSDEALVNSRDPETMARTFLYFYGAGGLLVLLSLLLPNRGDVHTAGLVLPALGALAVAGLIAWRFDRTPQWVFPWLPALGTLLISIVVYSSGAESIGVYSGLYFWAALSCFSFFGFRTCVANIAWIGVAYAVVLIVTPKATDPVLRWFALMGTLTVAAVVIALLRSRIEALVRRLWARMAKQERVAELGRRAVAGDGVSELSRMAVDAVAASLEVERAIILQPVPGGDELLPVAGTGGGATRPGEAVVDGTDALIRRILASEKAVIAGGGGQVVEAIYGEAAAGRDATTIGAAIPGRSEPLGALIAHSPEGRRFNRSDAALVEAVTHVLGDAIERQKSEDDARHRALHDPLTDRPNRLLFTDRVEQAVLKESEGFVGVFLVDIDDFKRINDAFGHAAGDDLLIAIGPRLREALMLSDSVARFGGDEFAVLCEGLAGETEALQVAERLIQVLAAPFEMGGAPYRVGATIGVAVASDGVEAEELIAQAEAAMYRAKERSRGSFEFFDDAMRVRLQRRLEFETALREAPELGQLSLAAQPIVSLPDYRPVGTEVLLRWRHPRLGDVSPAEFIPIAEESGAIIPIGRWVLEKALKLAVRFRSHRQARLLLPFHVNISVRQLAHPDFLDELTELVAATGVAVSDIALEITEHALLIDASGAIETLGELRGMGFSIVLDDFGTGYSSLSHLKEFPLDRVKVDRMFVANLTRNPEDAAIVRSVIGMAKAFGLHVIAEGVETYEQAERLAELGCWQAQGYLFSEPMPPDELVTGTIVGPDQSVSFRPTALSASGRES